MEKQPLNQAERSKRKSGWPNYQSSEDRPIDFASSCPDQKRFPRWATEGRTKRKEA